VVQEKGVKWIVRPAGNSGSRGDDKRYQDWHTFWRKRIPDFSGGDTETAGAK